MSYSLTFLLPPDGNLYVLSSFWSFTGEILAHRTVDEWSQPKYGAGSSFSIRYFHISSGCPWLTATLQYLTGGVAMLGFVMVLLSSDGGWNTDQCGCNCTWSNNCTSSNIFEGDYSLGTSMILIFFLVIY